MSTQELKGAGLRGQSAGETSICTVGMSGDGLHYRGYSVEELAEQTSFEEVAYLLIYGELPTQSQYEQFCLRLKPMRELPAELCQLLEMIPAHTHPMDVMRTGLSYLGNLKPEQSFEQQYTCSEQILAALPAIICYWYRFVSDGVRVDIQSDSNSLAGHFLQMLKGEVDPLHEKIMNVSLILYAEHEFNASTFTARVCASTLSDLYSCLVGAIGSLRGPLHGGANEAAMAMLEQWPDPQTAVAALQAKLAAKEKIMGFGHAVYRKQDPRNAIIKGWSKRLAELAGSESLYLVSEAVEQTMWQEKRLFANADFFHASAYHYMGIPTPLFTPIFVCSRASGWAAHVIEQRSNNRIIRPGADYTGEAPRPVVSMEQRA